MKLFRSMVAALLAVAMATQPAIGVVLNVGTFEGFSDAPQLATPVSHVTVFLYHSNGQKYSVKTNALGVARVDDIPPGTIEHCQAYQENNAVASWACNIPVGKEALQLAVRNATEIAKDETPQPLDSRPSTVLTVARKDGSSQHYVYVPSKKRFFYPPHLLFTYYQALIIGTWLITTQELLRSAAVGEFIVWLAIFFGRLLGETAGAGPGQDAGGDD